VIGLKLGSPGWYGTFVLPSLEPTWRDWDTGSLCHVIVMSPSLVSTMSLISDVPLCAGRGYLEQESPNQLFTRALLLCF